MIEVLLIPPIINPIYENNKIMPLGLLAIAANLRKNGYLPIIYKAKTSLLNTENVTTIAKDILRKKPEIIGFSTWCITYPASLLIAQQIKKKSPETTIIFGGPQASILPGETLRHFTYVDFVLTGEADYSFPMFLNEFYSTNPNLQNIPGLTFRTNEGAIVENPIPDVIENLDDLPVPAYDLVPNSKTLKLDVGRGCPFKCTYCTTNDFFSKKYRVKSVCRILHEMNLAFETSQINKFSFAHDMFTLNKKFISELCSSLIQHQNSSGINYTWTCSARTDCVSNEMLIQMKQAGCESIFFGIESGSVKIQKRIGKNLNLSKVHETANICREVGLNMHTSFIIGFPGETKNDVEKSLRCALKLATNGAFVQFSELSFLPGTPLFEKHHTELKLDGLFSNFSNTFCSNDELKLIIDYPRLFSSFYYFPVKTLKHSEMSFLSQLINNLSQFRNTLFLLSEIIEYDIKIQNLLQLFKKKYNTFSPEDLSNTPVVSHLTRFLRTYILQNKTRIVNPYITDVFSFEAFQGLLLAQFNRWQLIKLQAGNDKKFNQPQIFPTPAWNILTTNYKLNKVLPSENNWDTSKTIKRKSRYTYLLVAVSPTKCRRLQINKTDEYLLRNLSATSVDEFINKVGADFTYKEIILWLKKMKRLGVVQISDLKENYKLNYAN